MKAMSRSSLGILALMAAFCAGLASAAPTIEFEPASTVLDGDPVRMVVRGVPPGAEVTVTAERWFAPLSVNRLGPRLMRSEAVFVADSAGHVDVRTAAPVRGSYAGADARGLFWSMQPVAGAERAAAGTVDTAQVRFKLRSGSVEASAQLRLLPALPEVRVETVESLPGAVFASLPGTLPDGRKRPAVILIGGSEGGGLITLDAAPLASHGFAVLALPVFSPPDRNGKREIPALPAGWVDMPVETLNKARDWLARRPDVDATRIALHGTSMGSILVLLAGVHFDWVSGVVASVPSDVVWDGWGPGVETGERSMFTLGGKPLPFLAPIGYEEERKGYERNEPVIMRRVFERGRQARPDLAARARIPVERIRVPVMVIGGFDDQLWPSGHMAQNIAERRAEAGLPTEALLYPDAGHSLYDRGYAPTTGYNAGLRKSGGTPEANAKAQAEIWPKTVDFLRRVLRLNGP